MTHSSSGLQAVQQLYIIQMQLIDFLQQDSVDQTTLHSATEAMKLFSRLMSSVDRRYMGGDDVFVTLQDIQLAVSQKMHRLQQSTKQTSRRRRR